MFIVRMSYVELYNNRFRNLLSEGSAIGSGDGGSLDPGEAVGFGSSVGSGRGSWREAADGEVGPACSMCRVFCFFFCYSLF